MKLRDVEFAFNALDADDMQRFEETAKALSELQRYAMKLLPSMNVRQPQNQSHLTVGMKGKLKSRSG